MNVNMKIATWGLVAAAFAVVAVALLAGHSPAIATGEGLMLAAVVQSAYTSRMPRGIAGQVATMNDYDADTRICETAAGIGFGLAVGRGTNDNGAVLGGAAAADFLGISIKDITLVNVTPDKYAQYQNMAVMTRGVIFVTAGGNVADGDDVTFNSTTGVLSSAATSGTQFAIAGARWMDTVSSGEIGRVRLSGHLPSA